VGKKQNKNLDEHEHENDNGYFVRLEHTDEK